MGENALGVISAVVLLALFYALGAASWLLLAAGALTCLLIAAPVFLLVARPALAAAAVTRRPSEVIAFRPEGVVIRGDGPERVYEWKTIRRIWDVGPHYLLVANRHLGIHLPKEGLPAGALDYVRSRAALDQGA
jgi:hypothetical protein